jgi:hypothetical protein
MIRFSSSCHFDHFRSLRGIEETLVLEPLDRFAFDEATRFRARRLGARTPIKHLYRTGQDAGSAEVSGALFGGVLAASAILGRNLMQVVFLTSLPLESVRR